MNWAKAWPCFQKTFSGLISVFCAVGLCGGGSQGRRLMCVAALATILISGCRGSELRRVWGKVTFDGESIQEGTIEFSPVDGTHGPSAGGAIRDGTYEVPKEHGLLANGTYKVAIIAMKKTGRAAPEFADQNGAALPEYANYIPSQFNSATKLKVSIAEDESNEFIFHLSKDGINVKGSGGKDGRAHFDGS
jgi:hypothetical protein